MLGCFNIILGQFFLKKKKKKNILKELCEHFEKNYDISSWFESFVKVIKKNLKKLHAKFDESTGQL